MLALSVGALLGAPPALAGMIDGSESTIRYLAAPGETNDVVVRRNVSGVTLTDTAGIVVIDEGCDLVSPHEAFCPNGRRRGLLVRLEDMNDSIHVIGWFGGSGVDAGPGDDAITMSTSGDFLVGGEGKDTLTGGRGTDYLQGGPGDDVLDGGLGADTVDYSDRHVGVVVDLDGVADDGEPGEKDDIINVEGIRGGFGKDVLTGDAGPNSILGGEGGDGDGDLIRGRQGDDLLVGLVGDDIVYGGDGNDILYGVDGSDTLRGNAGNDRLEGLAGPDLLNGGKGADRMDGGRGKDRIEARDGVRDSVIGGD